MDNKIMAIKPDTDRSRESSMRLNQIEIVVIGNIVKETIMRPDEVIGPVLGGPCAYTSLALAKLGRNVGIVSYCSDDFWEKIREELLFVDDRGRISYMHTTENHLIYQNEEKNHVEYFKVAPVITFDVIPEEYLQAEVFFICPMDFEVSMEVCRKLHDMGKKIIVDLGGYGGTTSYNHFSVDTNRGYKLINDLCRYAHIIKASRDDMHYIMPDMEVEKCTEYLIARGPKYAVITMGSQGAIYQEVGERVKLSNSYLNVDKKRNLTGAGDVFVAGMIAAMLETEEESVEYMMDYGNSAASLVLQEKGGCQEKRMPTEQMVKLRMERKI